MEAAIGSIIKPNFLKNETLITMFKTIEMTARQKGVFVSFLAKKQVENIFNIANAGRPKAKKVSVFAVLITLSLLNEP